MSFSVRRVDVEGSLAVRIADREVGAGRSLLFQRGDVGAISVTDQRGTTGYGVRSAAVEGWRLKVVLEAEAAAALGIDEETEYFLELTRQESTELRDALVRIFA
jgi:hypothetical protein